MYYAGIRITQFMVHTHDILCQDQDYTVHGIRKHDILLCRDQDYTVHSTVYISMRFMLGSGLNSLMVHKHEMLYYGFILFHAFTIEVRCVYFSLNVSKIGQIFEVLYLIFVLIRCFRKALLY
jgi:hypothetical protein